MLQLAAGKAAGMLAVWSSGTITGDSFKRPSVSGRPPYSGNAHGSMAVSGVSWARCCSAQSVLCTTGLDGTVKAWRWHADKVSC